MSAAPRLLADLKYRQKRHLADCHQYLATRQFLFRPSVRVTFLPIEPMDGQGLGALHTYGRVQATRRYHESHEHQDALVVAVIALLGQCQQHIANGHRQLQRP